MTLLVAQLQPQIFFIIVLLLEFVTGVVQLMRHCREKRLVMTRRLRIMNAATLVFMWSVVPA